MSFLCVYPQANQSGRRDGADSALDRRLLASLSYFCHNHHLLFVIGLKRFCAEIYLSRHFGLTSHIHSTPLTHGVRVLQILCITDMQSSVQVCHAKALHYGLVQQVQVTSRPAQQVINQQE